jgi:hypothetical protein
MSGEQRPIAPGGVARMTERRDGRNLVRARAEKP